MSMMGLCYDTGEVLAIMKQYTCRSCAGEFRSNNELHKHLRSKAHKKSETSYSEEIKNYED